MSGVVILRQTDRVIIYLGTCERYPLAIMRVIACVFFVVVLIFAELLKYFGVFPVSQKTLQATRHSSVTDAAWVDGAQL